MEKLSIIMPVYNTEKYIARAIESILVQDVNFELIIIDDGSTDNSFKVCKKYSNSNKNIKLYRQKNKGQSNARNKGLSIATGDYITFVDSDDWISNDIYKYSLEKIKEYNADVLDFECKKTSKYINDASCNNNNSGNINIYKNNQIIEEFLRKGLSENNCPYSMCRKIFKSELFNNIKFPEGKINEDIITVFKVLINAEKMITINEIGYYYFQSSNSTTRNGLRLKDFDLIEVCEELYQLSKKFGGNIEYYAMIKRYRCSFSLLSKIAYYGIEDKEINEKQKIKELQQELRKNIFVILKSPMQKNRKLLATFFCINYKISALLIKLFKRFVIK